MVTFNKVSDKLYNICFTDNNVGKMEEMLDKRWYASFFDEFGYTNFESRDLKIIANKLDELNKV